MRIKKVPEVYQAERTISAVFKEEKQIDSVIRRLLDRNVPKDNISVIDRIMTI